MKRVVGILLALMVAVVGAYFLFTAQESGADLVEVRYLLDDSDGDGQIDLRDPCPCTADNQRRSYKGAEYCLAEQDSGEFDEMREWFDGEAKEEALEQFNQGFETIRSSNNPNIQENQVLYTKAVCEVALLAGKWPNRPALAEASGP